jgi:arachidonate 15-lipoxygenase
LNFNNYNLCRLGYYDKALGELYNQQIEDIFEDEHMALVNIIRQFQQNLNMAEQEIDTNNKKRVVAYHYLKPSLILNSISI